MRPAVGQGRQQHGCPILRQSKIRAISRVFVVIHGGVLLLAAYYGAHVRDMALVISANARLVAPADRAPFIGSAPLCLRLWRWQNYFGFPPVVSRHTVMAMTWEKSFMCRRTV